MSDSIDLGRVAAMLKGTTAPIVTDLLWMYVADPSLPNVVIPKYYNGTDWVNLSPTIPPVLVEAPDNTTIQGQVPYWDVTDQKYKADSTSYTIANLMLLTGATMTGDLILDSDPTTDLGATPKQYVDTRLATKQADLDDLTSISMNGGRLVINFPGNQPVINTSSGKTLTIDPDAVLNIGVANRPSGSLAGHGVSAIGMSYNGWTTFLGNSIPGDLGTYLNGNSTVTLYGHTGWQNTYLVPDDNGSVTTLVSVATWSFIDGVLGVGDRVYLSGDSGTIATVTAATSTSFTVDTALNTHPANQTVYIKKSILSVRDVSNIYLLVDDSGNFKYNAKIYAKADPVDNLEVATKQYVDALTLSEGVNINIADNVISLNGIINDSSGEIVFDLDNRYTYYTDGETVVADHKSGKFNDHSGNNSIDYQARKLNNGSLTKYNWLSNIIYNVGGTPGADFDNAILYGAWNLSGYTASQLLATDGSKNLVSLSTSTYPSLTELSYVKGVTSAIQTQLNSKLGLGGGTMTGLLILSGDPATGLGAATKQYVDMVAQGLPPKSTATVATTAALATNIYVNGSSGIGATITITATGTLTIDGHVVALNDIVLVKNEVTAANNGLYLCTVAGATGVSAVLTRTTDMDSTGEFSGAYIPVSNAGTANANSFWLCNPVGAVTVGTTAVPFTQLNGATDLIAGAGLTISGNTVSTAAPTGVAFGSTPNVNGASLASNTLTLQPADGTHPGGVSISSQTFAGAKTFSSAPLFSTISAGQIIFGGTSGAVTGDTALVWDNTNKRLGIGTSAVTKLAISETTLNATALSVTINSTSAATGIALGNSDQSVNSLSPYRFNFSDSSGSSAQGGSITMGKEDLWTSTLSTRNSFMAFYTTLANATAEKVRITSSGYVGIGTTSPVSLFSIGSSSQFQVNSSGAIVAATGITSSGTINFSGLTASQLMATDSSSNLVSLSTSTYPSLAELAYVKGVTGAIQAQINGKQDLFGGSQPAPIEGGTAALSIGYNAINPASSLSSATMQLPAGASDGSIAFIKYEKAITTVTYTAADAATVKGGIVSPVAGQVTMFRYNAGDTTWY